MFAEAIAYQLRASNPEAVVVPQAIVSPEAIELRIGVTEPEATSIAEEYVFPVEEAADTYKGREPSVFGPNLFKKDTETFFIESKQFSVAAESAPTDADYYTTTSLENVKNTDAWT